jgi:hypothetical protein
MDGDQSRHAAAFDIDFPDAMSRCFGGNQADIDVGVWHDLAEPDVETVREEQGLPGG